jgi:hypothetical protein
LPPNAWVGRDFGDGGQGTQFQPVAIFNPMKIFYVFDVDNTFWFDQAFFQHVQKISASGQNDAFILFFGKQVG